MTGTRLFTWQLLREPLSYERATLPKHLKERALQVRLAGTPKKL